MVNFDLSELSPKGKRIGIDFEGFSFMEMILKEKDFREKVAEIDSEIYRDAYVYLLFGRRYCSDLGLFLITSKLTGVAKNSLRNQKDLEVVLMHEAISHYNFADLEAKTCSRKRL